MGTTPVFKLYNFDQLQLQPSLGEFLPHLMLNFNRTLTRLIFFIFFKKKHGEEIIDCIAAISSV